MKKRSVLHLLVTCSMTHPPQVPLFVNKVGPYYNPHETYPYYTLPVCRPQEVAI